MEVTPLIHWWVRTRRDLRRRRELEKLLCSFAGRSSVY
jgi:hypothetical protein